MRAVCRKEIYISALTIALCSVSMGPATGAFAQDVLTQARKLDLQGKQDAAIALYREALSREPDSFDAHYGIARALDLTDNYDEAQQHFAKAIELAPEGSKDQALRMMGVSYAFSGNANASATYFKQVFDRRVAAGNMSGAAEAANELARTYLELGDPDNGHKWYRIGYDTALHQVNQAASEIDLAELRWAHAQGRVAARKGNAREARRQAEVVKRLLDKGTNPDQQIQYPYLLGYVHFCSMEYNDAIRELEKADQEDPFIMVLLAEAYEKLGNLESARAHYRRALASTSHAVNNAFARRIARQNIAPTLRQ